MAGGSGTIIADALHASVHRAVNYLAHTVLAEPTPQGFVGSLLGDFWHGAVDPRWPAALAGGVRLHRHVDAATDRHPAFASVRALLPAGLRRYAGILLDVGFDFVLTRQWARYSERSLRAHVDAVNNALLDLPDPDVLPPAFVEFARHAARVDLLARYGEEATMQRAFRSISRRLARENPVATAWDALAPLVPDLERALPPLMADLRGLRASMEQ